MQGQQGILVEELTVRYGDLTAVAKLSFGVEPGSVVALLGPNGSGKSSTVRCLVGIQEPSDGRIEIAGHDVEREARAAKASIGYVPEHAQLYDVLTPRETLLLKGRLHGIDDATILERGAHLLEVLGIGGEIDEPIVGFSKGMRQKVVFACALLTDPQVLVLDEPLSGLDAETTQLVKELLRLEAERGRAILYCSHLLDIVERVADRILILSKGEVVSEGSLEELRARLGGDPSLESIFRSVTAAADPRVEAQRLLDWPR